MYDFHMHSLFSDGELLPSEIAQRAKNKGYKVISITDHADESNLEHIITNIVKFADWINKTNDIYIIPGIEITHVPPVLISDLVKKARILGAKLIIVHGETIAEPVAQGTNLAALNSNIDILAHPGIITDEEVLLAKANNIFLEISTRRGHSYTNGHVFRKCIELGAKYIINSDSHSPDDLLTKDYKEKIAQGAGMNKEQILKSYTYSNELFENIKNKF